MWSASATCARRVRSVGGRRLHSGTSDDKLHGGTVCGGEDVGDAGSSFHPNFGDFGEAMLSPSRPVKQQGKLRIAQCLQFPLPATRRPLPDAAWWRWASHWVQHWVQPSDQAIGSGHWFRPLCRALGSGHWSHCVQTVNLAHGPMGPWEGPCALLHGP